MKSLFTVLLAANLLFWSGWQGWLGADVQYLLNPIRSEPMRLQQQQQAQRVIVGEQALSYNLTPPVASEKTTAIACLEIGPFYMAESQTIVQSLSAHFSRIKERSTVTPSGFLVYLPAQGTRAQSEALLQSLKNKGEKDMAVIFEASPLLYAISLGIYRTQEAARARSASLTAAGINGTRIVQRSERSPRQFVQVFEVKPEPRQQLDTLTQKTGLEWRACNNTSFSANVPAPKDR